MRPLLGPLEHRLPIGINANRSKSGNALAQRRFYSIHTPSSLARFHANFSRHRARLKDNIRAQAIVCLAAIVLVSPPETSQDVLTVVPSG